MNKSVLCALVAELIFKVDKELEDEKPFLKHSDLLDFPGARSRLENQDWSMTWRQFFRPQQITDGLTVVPAWTPPPSEFAGKVLRIDPGPAFGTGQHPTTRLCLAAMEGVSPSRSWTMLDVGTGSGILAIYGARLGARKIVGIDTDPEALQWAEKNIDLNGLTGSVALSSQPLDRQTGAFSLITANLTLETILGLLPDFPRLLERSGALILSGLLEEQVRRVQEELPNQGFHQTGLRSMEEWACLVVKKVGSRDIKS